ncbi:MAG: cysteine desulfurase family protein [Alphaproteobacteria bacterium]
MNLDQHAGGRVRPEVAEEIARLLRDGAGSIGNPSSAHAAGRRARAIVEAAREEVASLVGARAAEVVFTSGATESNAAVVAQASREGAHLVSTSIEHASVLRALDVARERGASVTLVSPDGEGRVAQERFAGAVRSDTALASIAWANGEIGTVQAVGEVAARVRAVAPGALLHSDAVQAVATQEIDFAASGLDALSFAGHKLGALPGVGALVLRSGLPLRPLLPGGAQERGRRAGTENVFGIASFGVAARLAKQERLDFRRRATGLVERLWQGVFGACAPVARLGARDGIPTVLALALPGLRGDALVAALDLSGIEASTGSACAAGGSEPSHVPLAIGLPADVARGVIRLSFGHDLDEAAVDRAIRVLAEAVERARAGARSPSPGVPGRASGATRAA